MAGGRIDSVGEAALPGGRDKGADSQRLVEVTAEEPFPGAHRSALARDRGKMS